MADLIAKLRGEADIYASYDVITRKLLTEAAEALTAAQAKADALRAEVERLREALHKALDAPMIDHSDRKQGVYDIIRAALSERQP